MATIFYQHCHYHIKLCWSLSDIYGFYEAIRVHVLEAPDLTSSKVRRLGRVRMTRRGDVSVFSFLQERRNQYRARLAECTSSQILKQSTMSATPPPPPVSLGKPSLRHRLESYYSLVAPEAIVNKEEWSRKFDIIYNKFGGDHIKETKLADKLAKKYGNQVRLLVAPPHRSQRQQVRTLNNNNNDDDERRKKAQVHDEQYYKIDTTDDGRINSKILDFTSSQFDAQYALSTPESIVAESNASIFSMGSSKLDNISKFRALLPHCDPQRLEPTVKRQNNHHNASSTGQTQTIHAAAKSNNETSQKKNKKKPPLFLAMASAYEQPTSGPLSLLYSILQNRQRIRIMIRYVDCIRGTLTGYLVAFDKHFNMILKDVDEVYGGRVTLDVGAVEMASGGRGLSSSSSSAAAAPSKSKLEAQRRKCYPKDGSGGPGPAVKQRYFNQLMVRGDNVVMVWRAEDERSMHPRTNKSPVASAYAVDSNGSSSGGNGKSVSEVGTPGSLYYALQRWENQSGRKRSS